MSASSSKKNLIDTITLIRKNQRNFENREEYTQILTNLYNEISYKEEKAKKKNQLNESDQLDNIVFNPKISKSILTKSEYDNFLHTYSNTHNQTDLIVKMYDISIEQKLPLIAYAYNEREIISPEQFAEMIDVLDMNIQQEPIPENEYNKEQLIYKIKMLLHFCYIGTKNIKIISVFMIFDLIFRNFKFVIDNKGFYEVVKNKINEFVKSNDDCEKIKLFCQKYNIDHKIIFSWHETLNNMQV